MDKEKLELEIKILIDEARRQVQSMQSDIKKLAQEAKATAPDTRALADSMKRMEGEVKRAATEAKLFGGDLSTVKRQQEALKHAMIDLVDNGISPESEEIKKLSAQYNDLADQSKKLETQSGATAGSIGDLTSAVGNIAAVKVLTEVVGKIVEMGGAALDTAKVWEKQEANFGVLLGSAEKGRALFKELQAFNVWTPFDLDSITNASQVLLGAQVSVGQLTDKMTMFGDLALGNAEKFAAFTNEFAKAAVKGKVDMGNLNIYLERGIPILSTLADQFGVTGEELQDMVSKGEVSAKEFEQALRTLTSEGGTYYQGMITGSQTLDAVQIGLQESVAALGASYMEALVPAIKWATQTLTDITNAINESPIAKGILAGALVAVTAYLAAMAVKAALLTVKTWLQYAAQMGLNSALAVTNPLLLAGIAAVGVATAAAVVYAQNQSKAADETSRLALAADNQASGVEQLTSAYESLNDIMADVADKRQREALEVIRSNQKSQGNPFVKDKTVSSPISEAQYIEVEIKPRLAGLSDDNLKKEIDRLQKSIDADPLKSLKSSFGDTGYNASLLKAMEEELKRRTPALEEDVKALKELAKKAAEFKDDWAKVWGKFQAEQTKNPTASVDWEEQQKLAEAAANGIGEKNKAVLDQIREYYAAQRKEINDKILTEEKERLAKITDTRVDDLELQKEKELAAFQGSSDARAKIAADYDKQIAKAGLEYSVAALYKEAEAAAKLTDEQADDMRVAMQKELALFEGTAAEKAALAAYREKQISEVAKQEAKTRLAADVDALYEAAEFAASISDSQAEAMRVALQKELALFEGTAEQKIALTEFREKQITKVAEQEAKARLEAAVEERYKEAEFKARIDESETAAAYVAMQKELDLFEGTSSQKAQLAAYWARQISEIADKELRTRLEKDVEAQYKAAALTASLTDNRVDDLEVARDKEFALFQGTEEQKALLAKKYAKEIADASIAEARRVFEEQKTLAEKQKDWKKFASLTFQDQAKDTEVGKMAGFGGGVAVDPASMAIQALAEFAMEIENVQKVLNPFGTILEGASSLLEPMTNDALQPLVDILMEVGEVLGQEAAPFLTLFATGLRVAAGIIRIAMVPMKLVGAAFLWLNDYVIVPFGNFVINTINAVIKLLNKLPFVNIKLLETLQTSTQIAAAEKQIAEKIEAVSDTMDAVSDMFDERREDLDDAYSKNVTSLKNLLELGAISESDYASRMDRVNTQYEASVAALDAQEEAQLAVLQSILDALNDGNNIATAALRAAGVQGYAVGAVEIPQTQAAIVHKGETIIPASFAEGLRSGQLTLGKGSSSSSVYQTVVNVTVQGSVQAENNLADAIARRINQRERRGMLELENA